MARPVNPYIAGAPLRGERGFFGRQGTLDWVARELCNPATNALVLSGQRRIGKTTLLLQLERILIGDAFLPVYFDLQDQATRSLGAVLVDLAGTVAERVEMEPPSPDAFDDRGHFFRRSFLPRLYRVLGEGRRPVFLLDEFDVLDQVAEAELPEEAAAKAFFPVLRSVMAEDPQLAFVFVVGRRAEDLSLDFAATFKASLVREVWVLDRESTEALVRQAEANGTLRFADQAIAHILSLTRCHPYLTQLFCQRIWERAYAGNPATPPRIDIAEVEAAVSDTLEAGDHALVWLWNGLSPEEKIYAAALAEVASEGEIITEDQVIHVLTTHAARLRTREVELAPRFLVKRRVLEEAGERAYCFAVELLRRWVRRNMSLQDVKNELDRVDPLAERLFRVGEDFSHRHQWETAVRYFRDALGANPRHFRARLLLGEALLEQGQADAAVDELEQAYELDRDEARLPLARALIAQAQARDKIGDEGGALDACEQVLEVSPNEQEAQKLRAAIWTRRGDEAFERGDLDTALVAYRQAGDSGKVNQVEAEQDLVSLFDAGVEALRREDWGQARQAFVDVIHHRPDYQKDDQFAAGLLAQAVSRGHVTLPRRQYVQLLAAVMTIAVLVLFGGSWVVNSCYFRPREVAWQAQATAQAVALATAAQETSVAQAGAATADAQTLATTATADAQALAAIATTNEQTLAAAATANVHALAAAATAYVESLSCKDIKELSYALLVVPEPDLFPPPGTVYVSGRAQPDVGATWVMTNVGRCPWEDVALQPVAGGKLVEPILFQGGEPITQVQPGNQIEVVLLFSVSEARSVDEEWVVVVDGLPLAGQSHLRLAIERWVVVASSTPTPVPASPTPTPANGSGGGGGEDNGQPAPPEIREPPSSS